MEEREQGLLIHSVNLFIFQPAMCHAWHEAWGKITIVSAPETWNREAIYQSIPVSSEHSLDKCCVGKVQVALREYERELT